MLTSAGLGRRLPKPAMRTLGSQHTATGDHRHTQKRDGCKGEVRGTARVWHLLDCDRLGHNAFGVIHGAWFVLIGRRTDIVFRLRHRAVLGRWRRVGGGRVPSLTRNARRGRSEEHTSELQSHSDLVCRLLLEKKKKN